MVIRQDRQIRVIKHKRNAKASISRGILRCRNSIRNENNKETEPPGVTVHEGNEQRGDGADEDPREQITTTEVTYKEMAASPYPRIPKSARAPRVMKRMTWRILEMVMVILNYSP